MIFTCSNKSYCDVILNYLDPEKKRISKVFYRNDWDYNKSLNIYYKNLYKIGTNM